MKTYTCDRCGFEAHEKRGIVGREFETLGFKTLAEAYRWDGVVDVCGPCFKRVQDAADAARKDAEKTLRTGFLARLGIGA